MILTNIIGYVLCGILYIKFGCQEKGCMLLDEANSTEDWIKNESAQKR